MAQKQSQQPTRMPAGLHIESGWSDIERKKQIKKHKESVDIDMIHSPLDNQFDYIVSDEKIRSQGFLPSQTIQTGILETFILLGGIE